MDVGGLANATLGLLSLGSMPRDHCLFQRLRPVEPWRTDVIVMANRASVTSSAGSVAGNALL